MADNKHAIAHLGHFWRIVIDNIHRRQICSGLYMVSGPPYRVLSRDVSQVAYWFRRPALSKAWTSAWTRGNAAPSTGAVSFFFFSISPKPHHREWPHWRWQLQQEALTVPLILQPRKVRLARLMASLERRSRSRPERSVRYLMSMFIHTPLFWGRCFPLINICQIYMWEPSYRNVCVC